jgi:hypothetical protein
MPTISQNCPKCGRRHEVRFDYQYEKWKEGKSTGLIDMTEAEAELEQKVAECTHGG